MIQPEFDPRVFSTRRGLLNHWTIEAVTLSTASLADPI